MPGDVNHFVISDSVMNEFEVIAYLVCKFSFAWVSTNKVRQTSIKSCLDKAM